MKGRLLLSPLVLSAAVILVCAGELAIGTNLYFVCMVGIALASAGLTYNMLGGLGRIAGIGFTSFALQTLVIGQIAKVVLLERADQNLLAPQLTITVYAVFFLSLMLGTFTFGRLRLPLPRPVEPATQAQGRLLYILSVVGGLFGAITMAALDLQGREEVAGTPIHGLARALAYLLPLSIVIAVDDRIRSTNGRHCFGWRVGLPTAAYVGLSFASTGRGEFAQPFVIIFLTAFLRGFRFERKHKLAGAAVACFLFLFVSPFYAWARGWRDQPTVRQQLSSAWRLLEQAPSQWSTITYNLGSGDVVTTGSGDAVYFPLVGAVTLNRIVLIAKDSTLINACASGFHYGFTAIKLDVGQQVPRFLYPNKPLIGSSEYLGHLDGQESDEQETHFSTITSIADSYGAFGWLGVVAVPLFLLPAVFVVYESMFDVTRPWGTAATVGLMAIGPVGSIIADTLIKEPTYLLLIAASAAAIFKFVPSAGDRSVPVQRLAGNVVAGAGVSGSIQ